MGSTVDVGPTRAVVVDGSWSTRTLIHTLLEDTDVEVVAEVADGCEVISVVEENRPDVVTMDAEIPEMNGFDTIEAIMEECPAPILVLSTHAKEDADVAFEALSREAVNFVAKPGGEVTSEMPCVKRELIEKIRSVVAADLLVACRDSRPPKAEPKSPATARSISAVSEATESFPTGGSTLIIGASTGGPNVVERVLAALPTEAGLRVLVVQHMPAGFTKCLATRLSGRCDYEVRGVEDGEQIDPGQIRIVPGGSHLPTTSDRAGRLRLELSDDEALHGVKPATDLTVALAVGAVDAPLAGVLLTGMGRDGVEGMTRIERAGSHTVARSEATSAVFGMPKRAIEIGCADTAAADRRIADEALSGPIT